MTDFSFLLENLQQIKHFKSFHLNILKLLIYERIFIPFKTFSLIYACIPQHKL